MPNVKTILLVCTGNSCRSVMAAGLLKRLLHDSDSYKIATAGTGTIKGMPPTKETIQVMSESGIDVSAHLSQPLTEEMIRQAEIILVMERRQRTHIVNRIPEAKDKVHLLAEFGRIDVEDKLVDPDIADPIGRPIDFYRKVFEVIKEGLIRAAKILKEQNP